MIEPILQTQLEPIVQRHRRSRFWRAAALGCAVLTPVLLVGVLLFTGTPLIIFLTLFACAAVGVLVMANRNSQAWEPDYREIARRIEHQHSDLHALLITAVEQRPDGTGGKLNFLQERVVRDANDQIRKLSWLDMATVRQMRNWQLGTFGLIGVWLAILFLVRTPEDSSAAVAATSKKQGVMVTPGDVNLERGSSLVVLARFEGNLPKEATMVIRPPAGTNEQRVYLTKNLGDPVFGGSVAEVLSNFTYRVDYDGKQTVEYKVRVYEHPRLEHADANINYPEYTKLAPKAVPETKRVSAVEGSKIDFTFKLNKPVTSAKLIGKDKSAIPLAIETNQPVAMLKQFPLMTNGTYNLELVDDEGRTNKIPAQFAFDALKNRAPELKVITPKGDQRVSPLEEVSFQGEAWDDFGLGNYGITYTIGGDKSKSIVLGEKTTAGEKRPFQQVLSLEELGVKPDQLVSWYLWAEDVGPDGKPRRTSSDMYFVEVRPFEEIYRQGNSMEGQSSQQQQQQQGGANQALKLAELQKQIINATWKLQRQETSKTPSASYGKDVPVVLESQENALEQAQALKEKAADPRTQGMVEAVEQAMQKAVDHLGEATNSVAPLPSALASEQAAYQALLKIAGREYMVTQNKGRESSSGQANQRNQGQLSQLDLKKEENRYETQRQAAGQPQSQEQKEQLAMLNRLKELAQRQQDLNDRIKELQNAMQEAKSDAEREEIKRRLKRLREEEQEMLADIDNLQNRMQQPQNQSQTAEAQKQLEQTRSEVQKASQALQNESASQALASGTRAQRNLQQMRDDLRKKSSSQFAEEMRQMRSQARELAQNQEEISKQMEASQEKERKSLRESGASEQLAQQLEQQKNSLTNLLENMRSVSEKSEASEPLLSKQLYDSFRKASQDNVEEKLKVSEELVKRSMPKEAGQVEQLAKQHIQDLKTGVEKAAESVLGDDVESLRLAKNELDALSKELDKELAQSNNGQKQDGQAGKGQQQQQNAQAGQGQKGPLQNQQGGQSGQQNQNGEETLAANNNPQEQQSQDGANSSPSQNQQQSGRQGSGQRQTGQQNQQASQQGQQQQQGEQNQQGQGQGQQQAKNEDSQQQSQQGGQSKQQGQGQQSQQGSQSQQQQASKGQQGGQSQQNQQNQQGQGEGQGQGQGQQQVASNQQNQQNQQPGQQGQPNNQKQNQKGQRGQGQGQGQQPAEQPNGQPGEQQAQTARNQDSRASSAQTARNKGFRLDNIPLEGGPEGPVPQGPLTGENYVQWSERLGNVEEMVDVPELRTEIARIRERARNARSNFKKQGQKPDWAQVRTQISGPLNEVRNRVSEELARRESKDALVPIDRDPVPARYSDLVRRYYEKLGSNNE